MSARTSLNVPNPFEQIPINFTAGGDNTIIAGVAGKRIKVFRLKLIVAATVVLIVKDGSVTVLDGPLSFSANEGMVLDWPGYDGPPWYTTSPGNALVINSSASISPIQVGGNLDYIQS